MDLINMELKGSEKDYENSLISEGQKYPYGLKLDLDQISIEKLGLKMPEINQPFQLMAMCEVCSISQYEAADEARMNLSLQITDMMLKPAPKEPKDAASQLYGA